MMAGVTQSLRAAAAALVLMMGLPGAAAADSADDAREFVNSLADQAIQALTVPDISRPERVRRFRVLFNDHFAVEVIGKWVLGRHWRRAEPAERDEYLVLFEDYVVVSYVDRFAEYAGERLQITKAIVEADGSSIVHSEILLPGSGKTPVRVSWRIDGADGDLKIADLVIEGVSMSTTLRSDFGSIIRREGGRLAGLLDVLRDKTASLKEAN